MHFILSQSLSPATRRRRRPATTNKSCAFTLTTIHSSHTQHNTAIIHFHMCVVCSVVLVCCIVCLNNTALSSHHTTTPPKSQCIGRNICLFSCVSRLIWKKLFRFCIIMWLISHHTCNDCRRRFDLVLSCPKRICSIMYIQIAIYKSYIATFAIWEFGCFGAAFLCWWFITRAVILAKTYKQKHSWVALITCSLRYCKKKHFELCLNVHNIS